ncbi:unnamed protein product [Owenia fusiformis]|uniref:Uncharacterized protein n=1 Tax=Owenia fusiformis TaxID=6347 RepID=A0A8J1T4D4_OWEFU|nr:unnamed protein product [Owenia fusiformis]
MPAILRESDWIQARRNKGMGNKLTCHYQAKYESSGNTTPTRFSDPFPIGFEIDEQSAHIVVEEDQTSRGTIRVRPRVPLLCPSNRSEEACSMMVELRAPDYGRHRGKCPSNGDNRQLVFETTKCTFNIYPSKWQEWLEIPVEATIDNQYDGDFIGKIRLYVDEVKTHPAWSNHRLPDIKVTVVDKDIPLRKKRCSSTNDPHMFTFDGRKYDNFIEGEFILYKHATLPIQVNMFAKKCGRRARATCNCGVAVRAGGNIFIVDKCQGHLAEVIPGRPNAGFRPTRIAVNGCDESALHIYRKANEYTVYLPHGGRVKITGNKGNFVNVAYFPSSIDWGNTKGLCGILNNDISDDLTDRNGVVHRPSKRPDVFSVSWRVSRNESLYNPRSFDPMPKRLYCSCERRRGEHNVECGFNQKIKQCMDSGVDISDRESERCKTKRSTTYHDHVQHAEQEDLVFEYDPDYVAPAPEWREGWDEAKAAQFCNDFMTTSQSYLTCADLPEVDSETPLEDCVGDIHITANTEWAVEALTNLQAQCGNSMSRNVTNWVPNNQGVVAPPKDVTDNLCPGECSTQGKCFEGKCQCNEGFEGLDCSVNSTQPPEIYNIPQRALCDIQQRPCLSTPIAGENFLEAETLTCQLEYALVTSIAIERVAETSYLPGVYEQNDLISCPLLEVDGFRQTPGIRRSMGPYGAFIRVSNDKITFSKQELFLTVYDSKCHICNETGSCRWKTDICVIDEQCYNPGERHPEKSCFVCDTARNTTAWSQVEESCHIEGECFRNGETIQPRVQCILCDSNRNKLDWTFKDNHCFIENQCYMKGAQKGEDPCSVCEPAQNREEWTHNTNDIRCRERPVETSTLSTTPSNPPPTDKVETGRPPVDNSPQAPQNMGLYIGIPLAVVVAVCIIITVIYCVLLRKPNAKVVHERGLVSPQMSMQERAVYDNNWQHMRQQTSSLNEA